jgi:hypothetical protein
MSKTSQLINDEWINMPDEEKLTVTATARAELEREQGVAVERELTTSSKREKFVKGYADELTGAVRVLMGPCHIVLMAIYRVPFKGHARVWKRLVLPCF